jgi:Flp pilus assembly protein CpaB
MKKNITQLVLIAFLVAATCTAGLYFLLGQAPPAAASGPTVKILVASKKLDRGQVLTSEDWKSVDWPGEKAPPGMVAASDALGEMSVVVPLAEGEPLTKNKLASARGDGGGMGVPVGMRAVSVRVADSPGVIRLLQAGHWVDLQQVDSNNARTFLRKMQVLELTALKSDGRGESAVVTLLAQPDQADQISLVDAKGALRLLLRNPTEDTNVSSNLEQPNAEIAGKSFLETNPKVHKAALVAKR